MLKFQLLVYILLLSLSSIAQQFEGQLVCTNFYLDPKTLKPMFEPIVEDVWISGSFEKIFMRRNDSMEEGGLKWKITDYAKGSVTSQQNYPNAKIVSNKICPPINTK